MVIVMVNFNCTGIYSILCFIYKMFNLSDLKFFIVKLTEKQVNSFNLFFRNSRNKINGLHVLLSPK